MEETRDTTNPEHRIFCESMKAFPFSNDSKDPGFTVMGQPVVGEP